MELKSLIESIGLLGIAAFVFAESGLFLGAFLPGDSLLFTAGFLASQGILDIRILIPLCFIAAVVGDSFGYAFGRKVGPWIFKREDSLLFQRAHLLRAQKFYEKHGGKTIIFARFMPIVRTFAPILAGVGRMHYPRFLAFNVIGGFFWAVGLSLAGFVLGNTIPGVDRYLLPIILAIILASVAPGIAHVLRDQEARRSLINSFKSLMGRGGKAEKSRAPTEKITLPQDYRNTDTSALNHVIPMAHMSEASKTRFTVQFGSQPWFKSDVPIRQKTTYRLGGPADFFLTPKTIIDMQEVITASRELGIPLFVLGGGSNVLFSDQGWRGVVLQPANTTISINNSEPTWTSARTDVNPPQPLPRGESIEIPSNGGADAKRTGWVTRWEAVNAERPAPPQKPEVPLGLPMIEVTAGAGASLQQLIITTHQQKLVGLESFFGIPARVGGALRNNVHGGPDNFDRYVKEATLLNLKTGEKETWPKEKFVFSYDHSILQQTRDWLIWEVTLMIPQADDTLWQQFDNFFTSWRQYKCSTQTASGTAGCVFKNIPPDVARAKQISSSAGALIDSLFGLNASLRTARISALHGNFLQSEIPSRGGVVPPWRGGGGSSDDMLSLINFVRETVKERTGVDLELEIELVGF